MRALDEIDAPVGLERAHVQIAPQLADRVDADHLAERVELVQVGVELALVSSSARANVRATSRLPDARRPVEEIRVRRPLAQRRVEQARGLGVLREAGERAHGPPRRSPRGRAPSSATIRSGSAAASAR